MIVSPSRGFIFVHPLRAGGAGMELALAPFLAWDDLILGTTELGKAMDDPFRRAFGLHAHSTVEEIVAVCGRELFERCFSFALVRHPVERVASMYRLVGRLLQGTGCEREALRRRILGGEADPRWPFLSWAATRGYLESDGFSGFIRAPIVRESRIFVPQVAQLRTGDGESGVDLAIRLDQVEAMLPALRERLRLPLELPPLNRAPEADDAAGPSPEDRALIRGACADDYEAFGFE